MEANKETQIIKSTKNLIRKNANTANKFRQLNNGTTGSIDAKQRIRLDNINAI